MNNNEIISLQIGNFANFVGSHLWSLRDALYDGSDDNEENIDGDMSVRSVYFHQSYNEGSFKPRCVAIDYNENYSEEFDLLSSTMDSMENDIRDCWRGGIKSSDVRKKPYNISENTVWADLLPTTLHPKSICSMPKWTNESNFDSFYKGTVGKENCDNITDVYLDEVMDRLRYFAEACNSPSAINCLVDLQGGFGGLACSLVERIAEDYGQAFCVPVWAITQAPGGVCGGSSAKEFLQQLDIPLSYSRLMEHAAVFIPLDADQSVSTLLQQSGGVNIFNSSLSLALAIEASSNFHISKHGCVDRNTVRDWSCDVTSFGRFPLCMLEASLSGFPAWNDVQLDGDYLRESVAHLRTTTTRDCWNAKQTLNPFAHSFSAVNFGNWAVKGEKIETYQRPFTNVLNVRGDFPSDLNEMLLAECLESPYLISQLSQRQLPHFVRNTGSTDSYHDFGRPQDRTSTWNDSSLCSIDSVAGVGSGPQVGRHLDNIVDAWRTGSQMSAIHLDKVGLSAEERTEITEMLLTSSQRYHWV